MTTYNKASLKTFFAQGDVPSGTDYANFIDSYVNIVDTAVQVMASELQAPQFTTALVSATNGNFTGTVSAVTAYIGTGNFTLVNTSALYVSADVSAPTGTIYASAVRSTTGLFAGVGVVSAAGTTQGAAAVLTNVINRGKGIADGSTTGFTPLANRTGLVQYLFNEGASANLWPPTGGTINGLAANAAFALAASAMVTIIHLTASAYGVK